jgi:hypothetical protein
MKGSALIRGLRLESDLAAQVLDYAKTMAAELGLPEPNAAAAARHLMRLGLQYSAADSCHREGFKAGLAMGKRRMNQALAEAHSASE